jgi:uncharacterized membrane protein YdjX (TVP38/TMEM64 family)
VHSDGNLARRFLASWRDLGPLRPIAVASAVLPTVGALVLLANLDGVTAALPGGLSGALAVTAAIAVAVAVLLLPPSFAAFAVGYGFGPWQAVPVVVVATASAAWLGRCCVWPLVAAPLFAFMQARPRVLEVQRCCGSNGLGGALQVALLRGSARVPFAVVTLLLTAARTSTGRVVAGSAIAAVPLALLAGTIGGALRVHRASGTWPEPGAWLHLSVAVALALVWVVAARRWRARQVLTD